MVNYATVLLLNDNHRAYLNFEIAVGKLFLQQLLEIGKLDVTVADSLAFHDPLGSFISFST